VIGLFAFLMSLVCLSPKQAGNKLGWLTNTAMHAVRYSGEDPSNKEDTTTSINSIKPKTTIMQLPTSSNNYYQQRYGQSSGYRQRLGHSQRRRR